MAYALLKITVQLGRGALTDRAAVKALRSIGRSAVTAGTCWLKCIKSVTSRRYGVIGNDRPTRFGMVAPRAKAIPCVIGIGEWKQAGSGKRAKCRKPGEPGA